jgi:dolichol-phosphate mannosyltransferase
MQAHERSVSAFAVVVPMFNEEAGARRCIDEITRALRDSPASPRLVVVNDGSSDRTGEILAAAENEIEALTVVTHQRNLGYGQAIQTGGRTALELGYDFVIFMDSDLTNNPRFIHILAKKMGEDCDLVKASRYIEGGGVENVPPWRYWISRVGNAFARLLYGLPVHDCTNGFRAIRTELLAKMHIRERGFPAIMEELYWAKALRARVCEVPYILTSRAETLRPSSFEYRPRIFYSYLKYPLMTFLRIHPSAIKQDSL